MIRAISSAYIYEAVAGPLGRGPRKLAAGLSMPLVFGVHGEREAANPRDQGAAPLRGRSCLHCRPGQDTFHTDELVAVRHGIRGKQPERAGLVAKLESKASLQIN